MHRFLVITTVVFLFTGCSTNNEPTKQEQNQKTVDVNQKNKTENKLTYTNTTTEQKIENNETNQTSSVVNSIGDKVADKAVDITLNKMVSAAINSIL